MSAKASLPISIIIRTRNEAKVLDFLLGQIKDLESDNKISEYEIILVDNESSDNIKAVAKKYGAQLLTIADKEFSYPKAWNLGLSESRGEFVVFISAHAELKDRNFFNTALGLLENKEVAGVFANLYAMPDAPVSEKFSYWLGRMRTILKRVSIAKKDSLGLFGTTSAVARGSLIRETGFDEEYGQGGEDSAWGTLMINRGYKILRSRDLKIYHSHRLSMIQQLKQLRLWTSLDSGQEFNRKKINEYRKKKY